MRLEMMRPKNEHKRFFLNVMLGLAALFSAVGAFNYALDPFKMNMQFEFGLPRDTVSAQANPQLLKIIQFDRKPCRNIILGDSRGNAFATEVVEELTGEEYFNFSFHGSSPSEARDILQRAAGSSSLKNVYMAVNFDYMGRNELRDSVAQAARTADNPLIYYFSIFTSRIAARNLADLLRNKEATPSNPPPRSQDEHWRFMLEKRGSLIFRNMTYPNRNLEILKDIKHICETEGARLVFIIPPTHADFRNLIGEHGLTDGFTRFKADLAAISETADCDFDGELTEDRNNFSDPTHVTKETIEIIAKDVFTGEYAICRNAGM